LFRILNFNEIKRSKLEYCVKKRKLVAVQDLTVSTYVISAVSNVSFFVIMKRNEMGEKQGGKKKKQVYKSTKFIFINNYSTELIIFRSGSDLT
jgi:hypothetical protein